MNNCSRKEVLQCSRRAVRDYGRFLRHIAKKHANGKCFDGKSAHFRDMSRTHEHSASATKNRGEGWAQQSTAARY
eukprot:IDg5434t1